MDEVGWQQSRPGNEQMRLGLLEQILNESRLLRGAMDLLSEAVIASLGVPIAIVALVGSERQHFIGQSGLMAEAAAGTPISHSFCQHVVADGEVLVIDHAEADPLVCDNPAIQDYGVAAYAGQPITVHGQVVGSMCAIDTVPRAWTPSEVTALRAFADLAEYLIAARLATETQLHQQVTGARARDRQQADRLAVYEARANEQGHVQALNRRLQRALLFPRPSSAGGLELKSFYRSGSERLLLGGDFVDAMQAADGAINFVIGDVTGHGPEAAALAIGLRASWHALEMVGTDLCQIVSVLDRQAAETELFATVLLGRMSAGRQLSLVSAGHPAPITFGPAGAHELSGDPGPMLGMELEHPRWPVSEHDLSDRVLIAFTDGLTEGHVGAGRERFGTERLLGAIAELGADPEALCQRAIDANGGPLPDDVAILTIGARAT